MYLNKANQSQADFYFLDKLLNEWHLYKKMATKTDFLFKLNYYLDLQITKKQCKCKKIIVGHSDPNLKQHSTQQPQQPNDVIVSLSPVHTCEANANDEEQCQQAKRRDASEADIIEG